MRAFIVYILLFDIRINGFMLGSSTDNTTFM